jgi:hypothetical protein
MGLPGTKYLLHSLGKALEKAAEHQTTSVDWVTLSMSAYANAGDDIMKPGSLKVLRRHKKEVLNFKLVPSEDKWGIYLVGGPFCEVMVALGGLATTKPWLHPGRKLFLQESPRPRLLSPETKPRTGDDDTNPSFGKGRALGKELTWCEPQLASLAGILFIRNFREYGDQKPLAALPYVVGGYGFPMDNETRLIWLGPILRRALAILLKAQGAKRYRLVKAIGGLVRPLLFDRGERLNDSLEDPLKELLLDFSWSLEEVEAVNNITYPYPNVSYYKRAKRIEAELPHLMASYSISVPRVPLWERKPKPEKGWATAPLSLRLKRLEQFISDDLETPELTLQQLVEFQELKDYEFKEPIRYIMRDMEVYDEDRGHSVPLNLSAKSGGCSLRFNVSNRDFLLDRKT